jgi:hypothetical protein
MVYLNIELTYFLPLVFKTVSYVILHSSYNNIIKKKLVERAKVGHGSL